MASKWTRGSKAPRLTKQQQEKLRLRRRVFRAVMAYDDLLTDSERLAFIANVVDLVVEGAE